MIHFTIPAVPIAQPRPRAVVRANGRAGVFGAKDSHPVHAFKALAALAARQAYRGAPLEGPIEIEVAFVLERPKNLCWKTKPMPREWHTKKPDADNLVKSLADALTGILWRDDAQICVKRLAKYVAAGDEPPHVEVRVREAAGKP